MSSINDFLIFISKFLGCQAPTSSAQAQNVVNKNANAQIDGSNNNVLIWSYSEKYAPTPAPNRTEPNWTADRRPPTSVASQLI